MYCVKLYIKNGVANPVWLRLPQL